MTSSQRLSERLKALGVKVGPTDLAPPKQKSPYEIDSVVAGTFHPTRRGEVFIVEQAYMPDYHHGSSALLASLPFSLISQWANDPLLADMPLSRFAFLDTETSGLSGGTGTYAFMVGIGRFVEDQFILRQYFMPRPRRGTGHARGNCPFPCASPGPGYVQRQSLRRAAARNPLSPEPHPGSLYGLFSLDLLPLARRLWRDRLESRALKYLEQHVLSFTRSMEEVQGYEVPWLYFDYLRTGDARPLAGVFYHNAMDVVAMAALLAHINEVVEHPYEGRVEHGLDFVALGKLFEDLGHWEEAARLFERGLELNLTESDFGLAVKRLAILQKRRGDFNEAVRLWETAAANGHVYAHIEMAKYYEHKCRDAKTALQWTRSALEHVEHANLAGYMQKYWREEINHRLARLERKLKTQKAP